MHYLRISLFILLAAALTVAPLMAAPMPCGQHQAGDSAAIQDDDQAHAAMGHDMSHDMGHGMTNDQTEPGASKGDCCPDCPSSCTSATGVTLLVVAAGNAGDPGAGSIMNRHPDDVIGAGAPNAPYRPPNTVH